MKDTFGIIAGDRPLADETADAWLPFEPRYLYTSDECLIATDSTESESEVPASAETDFVRCWLLGDVYGYAAPEHEPRPTNVDPAQYCLSLYEQKGFEFLERVNGNYTLLVYDRETQRFTLCTDRFGTVPIYWTRADGGAIVFSTNIQLLPSYPAVDTTYNPAYLHEYLAFRCTFGVRTPLEGVEKLKPGTTTSVAIGDGSIRTEQY